MNYYKSELKNFGLKIRNNNGRHMTSKYPHEYKLEIGTIVQENDYFYINSEKHIIPDIGSDSVVDSDAIPIYRAVNCLTCKHSTLHNNRSYCSKASAMICIGDDYREFELKATKIPTPKKLQLYVWEGVLADYTDGVMFALAHDVEEAKLAIVKSYDIRQYNNIMNGESITCEDVINDLKRSYTVHDTVSGFHLHGGG